MASDRSDRSGPSGPPGDDEPFDAIAAAAELTDALEAADAPAAADGADGSARYIETLERELLELNELLARQVASSAAAEARAARAQDEVSAAAARLQREAEREVARKTHRVLLGFVEVLDDFDRALGAARLVEHHPEVVSGLELVRRRMVATLETFGVRCNPARGMAFDATLHEAVSLIKVASPEQDGQVLEVVREGYTVGDELLRPALVVVGKRG